MEVAFQARGWNATVISLQGSQDDLEVGDAEFSSLLAELSGGRFHVLVSRVGAPTRRSRGQLSFVSPHKPWRKREIGVFQHQRVLRDNKVLLRLLQLCQAAIRGNVQLCLVWEDESGVAFLAPA